MITTSKTIGNDKLWEYATGIMHILNDQLGANDERTRREVLALNVVPGLAGKYIDWVNTFLAKRFKDLHEAGFEVTIRLEFVFHSGNHDDFSIAIRAHDL